MGWLVRHRKGQEGAPAPHEAPVGTPVPTWSTRLGRIGQALDATGLELAEPALLLEGGPEAEDALVTALAWRTSRYHQRWSPLSLRVVASQSYELRPDAMAPLEPALPAAAPRWARRYTAVGALLDALATPILAPAILDVGDNVVITALMPGADPAGGWHAGSFGYTRAQIEAAEAAHSQSASVTVAPA